jgi:hypothetical protein
MKVNITNAANSDGIIIIDILGGFSQTLGSGSQNIQTTLPIRLNRLEFEINDNNAKVISIGTTSLAPTVNQNVTGFEFDTAANTIKVMNGTTVVYNTSTDRKTVLVRVDFNTATITVFQ